MKNPVDDVLFDSVGQRISRIQRLSNGIARREKEIKLEQQLFIKECKHLTEQGYDIGKIHIVVVKDLEE